MTIRITTDVFCDGRNCAQWCEGVVGSKADATAARANAARKDEYGKRWVYVGKKDLCPDCAPPPPAQEKKP